MLNKSHLRVSISSKSAVCRGAYAIVSGLDPHTHIHALQAFKCQSHISQSFTNQITVSHQSKAGFKFNGFELAMDKNPSARILSRYK